MTTILAARTGLQINLSEHRKYMLGFTECKVRAQVDMVPARCIRNLKDESYRGCVLSIAPGGSHINAVGLDWKAAFPIDSENLTLFREHPEPICEYPRVPIFRFRAHSRYQRVGQEIPDIYVYVTTPEDVTEFHKHNSQFIRVDINRVRLSMDTIEPIMWAVIVTNQLHIKLTADVKIYQRTVDELAAFWAHANRHLLEFAAVIGRHVAPYHTAISRDLQPMSTGQFNDKLRSDVSVELFEDLVRSGCVIAGAYVLQALTNGQSFQINRHRGILHL